MNPDIVNQIIRSRKSTFPPQLDEHTKIKDEVVRQILENANYAPSHYRTEPWRFIVYPPSSLKTFFEGMIAVYQSITSASEQSEAKIKKMRMKAKMLSHLIVIVMKRDAKERLPADEERWSVACAVQNMYLSCASYGVGAYWGTGKLVYSNAFKEYLQLNDDEECMGLFQMGVPKGDLKLIDKKPLTAIDDKIIWR